MRTFRCIYVNCFNRFRFLAEVSIKFLKILLFGNLRTINPEENGETRQMTLFFPSTFSTLTVYNIYFCIRKKSKFVFMGYILCFILVCKITQFRAKSYQFGEYNVLFQKIDNLRLLKIHIMFAHQGKPKNGISSQTISLHPTIS